MDSSSGGATVPLHELEQRRSHKLPSSPWWRLGTRSLRTRSLRTRSRQPVKCYKKILTDIFPATQITAYLEQRCYKELRKEQYGFAKVVVLIYRKLLVSCKEQMPLLASSLLSIICTLLDQTRQDDMRIAGCETLFDFAVTQVKEGLGGNVRVILSGAAPACHSC